MHRIALLALTACAVELPLEPTIEAGRLEVCLGSTAELELAGETYDDRFTGTVIEPGDPRFDRVPCGGATEVLSLRDDTGEQWWLGWKLLDDGGADITPALDLPVGTEVDVFARYLLSHGTAAGVVLRDDAGLLAAIEMGSWGPGLEAGDLPEVEVSTRPTGVTEDDDCGTVAGYEVAFTTDAAETVLVPVSEEIVEMDGQAMTAIAAVARGWEGQMLCTDLAGEVSWAIVR